jgi:hypothetical protein
MTKLEPAATACLEHTRSVVLNVLVAVGCGIAVSGFLLRWRDTWMTTFAPETVKKGLLAGLLVLTVTSYSTRRVLGSRAALLSSGDWRARFFRVHVGSAAIGALAIPLGFVYGWFVQPRLDGVIPFWVAALALGFLALPRTHELEGLELPPTEPREPTE